MKPFRLLSIIITLIGLCSEARAQTDTMSINLRSGTSIKLAIKDIRKLTFQVYKGVKDEAATQGVLTSYPNPISGQTVFRFDLKESAPAKISIRSLVGVEVRTINVYHTQLGSNEVVWDGRGDDGRHVVAGTYIAEILSGNSRAVQKLIVTL